MSHDKIQDFIAKARMKLKTFGCKAASTVQKWELHENNADMYGITPSLDTYLRVNSEAMLGQFWSHVKIGDVVVGRIKYVNDNGLVIDLLCFDKGKALKIDLLQVDSFCSKSEIPKRSAYDNVLKKFSCGDLVRGKVIFVSLSEEKIFISFLKEKSCGHELEYGVINEEDLPTSYKRSLTSEESYDKILNLSVGFYNPHVVQFLSKKLVSNSKSSFVDDLHNIRFPLSEYAKSLRKRQSSKVAEACVKRGAELCRREQMMEALAEMNKALELDPTNVDALVGRGAIYANKTAYLKAIESFSEALDIEPKHRNAHKYLLEVLVQRGKMLEKDVEQIAEAKSMYERALRLDSGNQPAFDALSSLKASGKLEPKRRAEDLVYKDKRTEKDEQQTSLLKVKQLLVSDVNKSKKSHKRKRSVSTSSSSSSSSSDESSSSSSFSSSSSSELSSDNSASKHKRKKSRRKTKKSKHHHKKSKKSKKQNYSSSSKKLVKRSKSSHNHSEKSHKKRLSRDGIAPVVHKSSRLFEYPSKATTNHYSKVSLSSGSNQSKPKDWRRSDGALKTSQSEHNLLSRRKRTTSLLKVDKNNINSILSEISKFESEKKT